MIIRISTKELEHILENKSNQEIKHVNRKVVDADENCVNKMWGQAFPSFYASGTWGEILV